MTASSPTESPPLSGGSVALRACARGVLASGLVPAVAWLTGLAAGAEGFALLGWGTAAATGCAGLMLQARLATVPAGQPALTARYIGALFGNFLLQAIAVAMAVLALVLLDVKFSAIAVLAVTFAASATVLHTVGVAVIAAALRARSSQVPGAGAPASAARRGLTQ